VYSVEWKKNQKKHRNIIKTTSRAILSIAQKYLERNTKAKKNQTVVCWLNNAAAAARAVDSTMKKIIIYNILLLYYQECVGFACLRLLTFFQYFAL
jgi:hypothetical protein